MSYEYLLEWMTGTILILSSLGVILIKKPVHASLSFLLTLMTLATLYLELSAQFIGVMQILVYAGAILVIFMFVVVLFQDAYQYIDRNPPKSSPALLLVAAATFLLMFGLLGRQLVGIVSSKNPLPENFGSVEALGEALYVDFFFPFEAVILIFLVAVVGALYIGRKV